jgi:hypothetical protein
VNLVNPAVADHSSDPDSGSVTYMFFLSPRASSTSCTTVPDATSRHTCIYLRLETFSYAQAQYHSAIKMLARPMPVLASQCMMSPSSPSSMLWPPFSPTSFSHADPIQEISKIRKSLASLEQYVRYTSPAVAATPDPITGNVAYAPGAPSLVGLSDMLALGSGIGLGGGLESTSDLHKVPRGSPDMISISDSTSGSLITMTPSITEDGFSISAGTGMGSSTAFGVVPSSILPHKARPAPGVRGRQTGGLYAGATSTSAHLISVSYFYFDHHAASFMEHQLDGPKLPFPQPKSMYSRSLCSSSQNSDDDVDSTPGTPLSTNGPGTSGLGGEYDRDLLAQMPENAVVDAMIDYYFLHCQWIYRHIWESSFRARWDEYKSGHSTDQLTLATCCGILALTT